MPKAPPSPPRGRALDPTIKGSDAASRKARRHLLVTGPQIFAVYDLPEQGELRIGRAENVDVCIDDVLISRHHAVLHVGESLEIEDLGSANGTRIGERALEPRQRVALLPGEAISVGSALLVVERSGIGQRPRRFLSHGYFESRLEEECARSERTGEPFAVIRILADATQPSTCEAIAASFRTTDVLAEYAPNDFEVLLSSTDLAAADAIAGKSVKALTELGVYRQSGIVTYPRDGRSPEAIVSAASASVRGLKVATQGIPLITEDDAMKRLFAMVARIAVGTINVLILGETGVGKEIVAEAVHRASRRKGEPFLRLNCAALTESLAESELFGYEKGAFTGALKAKPGLLVAADGGTVLLDEVGELSPTLQAKLLRAIETKEVLALGATEPRSVDVRFVAATNRDLDAEVAKGSFRQDLFFRLSGFTLHVPPLRERPSEIGPLVRAFARESAARSGLQVPSISEEAAALLHGYSWPGNIRELRNVIERAVLLSVGSEIAAEHLPLDKMKAAIAVPSAPAAPGPLGEGTERDRVLAVLAECAGNQSRAAKRLGISRGTLVSRLERYGLPRPRKRGRPE